MNIGTGHQNPGLQVINLQENRTDYADENDMIGQKLKEQVLMMKRRQEELLKELEDIDKNPISQVVPPEIPTPQPKEIKGKQTGKNSAVAAKNSRQLSKNANSRNAREEKILEEKKANEKQKPAPSSDNFSSKINQMNIKLFEMQQKVKQKEMERIQKDQEDKLHRLKKEKDVIQKQTDKMKTEINTKNNKLKEQIEKAKVMKDSLSQKQQQVNEEKQQREVDIRKIETKEMQIDYDIQLQISEIAKQEGILSSLKILIRERDHEIKNLLENIRVENLENQKLFNDLGETKKQITKLEFDQAKVRDERDRLIKEIEKKNDQNNKKYTSLFEDYLKLEAKKSERQVHINSLNRQLEKKKEKVLDLKSDNKIILNRIENMDAIKRKIQKKEKKIFEIEADIETSKKEKRVEIVEKIIERPIVIEKPVIVEKPVLIREEIRINEPIQLEIVRVKGEMNNLSRANNEMINEIDYWRKKCIDQEDGQKIRVEQIRITHDNEKLMLQEKIQGNEAQIHSITEKMNSIYTEIETLIQSNQSKNSQLANCLGDVYGKNKNLESVIMTSTFPQQLNTTY